MTHTTPTPDGLPELPETRYNGCGDGSEPLYTAEMMRAYGLSCIAASPSAFDLRASGIKRYFCFKDGMIEDAVGDWIGFHQLEKMMAAATHPAPAGDAVLYVRQMDLDHNRGTLIASPNADENWTVPLYLAATERAATQPAGEVKATQCTVQNWNLYNGGLEEAAEIAEGENQLGIANEIRSLKFAAPISEDAGEARPADAHPVVGMLLEVARLAHDSMDNTEDDGATIFWNRDDFHALSDAMDKLEALPDDQPGIVMGPAAKAAWALRPTAVMAGDQEDPIGDMQAEARQAKLNDFVRAAPASPSGSTEQPAAASVDGPEFRDHLRRMRADIGRNEPTDIPTLEMVAYINSWGTQQREAEANEWRASVEDTQRRATKAEKERDDLRAQLAAATADLATHKQAVKNHAGKLDAVWAEYEAFKSAQLARPADLAGHCERGGGGCVCGGDTKRVRESCGYWVSSPVR